MIIAQAVSRIGTEAVDHFMATRLYGDETRIGETGLTGYIAQELTDRLGWSARGEGDYRRIGIDRCGLLEAD